MDLLAWPVIIDTNAAAYSTVSIVYAMNYAHWVHVRVEVRAGLHGSTTSAVQYFDLPGAAGNYDDPDVARPGTRARSAPPRAVTRP